MAIGAKERERHTDAIKTIVVVITIVRHSKIRFSRWTEDPPGAPLVEVEKNCSLCSEVCPQLGSRLGRSLSLFVVVVVGLTMMRLKPLVLYPLSLHTHTPFQ